MRIFTTFIVLLLIHTCAYGQEDINYGHRLILKALSGTMDGSEPKLDEITLPKFLQDELSNKGKYFSVSAMGALSDIAFTYIGRIYSCRAGGCSVSFENTGGNDFEYFDYFIFYDSSCVVKKVSIFNYQATHGQEVASKGWLKQFTGFNGNNELQVGKQIDAISGATISVYGITSDVMQKTNTLKIFTQKNITEPFYLSK